MMLLKFFNNITQIEDELKKYKIVVEIVEDYTVTRKELGVHLLQ